MVLLRVYEKECGNDSTGGGVAFQNLWQPPCSVSTLHFLQECTPNRSRDSLSICTFGCNRPRGRPLEGAAAAASGPSEQMGQWEYLPSYF